LRRSKKTLLPHNTFHNNALCTDLSFCCGVFLIITPKNKDKMWRIIVEFVDKVRHKTLQELHTWR